jgi:hypothetical protein
MQSSYLPPAVEEDRRTKRFVAVVFIIIAFAIEILVHELIKGAPGGLVGVIFLIGGYAVKAFAEKHSRKAVHDARRTNRLSANSK